MWGRSFLTKILGLSLLILWAGAGSRATAQPDLRLLSSVSSNPIETGANLAWSWTVTNEGSTAATGVQIQFVLPAASADVVALNAGSFLVAGLCSSGQICFGSSCPVVTERCMNSSLNILVGNLPAGASASASVVLNYFGAGSNSLNSSVTANETDPTPANNSTSIPLLVKGLPGLRCYQRGSRVEYYWNAPADTFHLEETTNLNGTATWSESTSEIYTDGGFHAKIFTNLVAQINMVAPTNGPYSPPKASTNLVTAPTTYFRLASNTVPPIIDPGPFVLTNLNGIIIH
jgi:hypothetical protein